jgi:hypothetical protein
MTFLISHVRCLVLAYTVLGVCTAFAFYIQDDPECLTLLDLFVIFVVGPTVGLPLFAWLSRGALADSLESIVVWKRKRNDPR